MLLGFILATILGMGWGSFATMAIYRIPHGEPWIGKKPYCPSCRHDLTFLDYISLFSLLLWRGKCRYCKAPITHTLPYFFTELASTCLFIACYLRFGFGSEYFFLISSLGMALIILAVIVQQHHLLPARVLYMSLLLAAIYRTYAEHSSYAVVAGFVIGALVGVMGRHVCFALKGKATEAMDYLTYGTHDRFGGEGFSSVILCAIFGVMLPLKLFAVTGMLALLIHAVSGKKLCWQSSWCVLAVIAVLWPDIFLAPFHPLVLGLLE